MIDKSEFFFQGEGGSSTEITILYFVSEWVHCVKIVPQINIARELDVLDVKHSGQNSNINKLGMGALYWP